MMGPRQVEQGVLFYNFSLDGHVPADHLLRSVDRFVDLAGLRREQTVSCAARANLVAYVDPRRKRCHPVLGGARSRRLCSCDLPQQ